MASKSIHLKIPKEIYQKLEFLKKKKGRLTVQELIREAIDEYLEKEGMKEVVLNGTAPY